MLKYLVITMALIINAVPAFAQAAPPVPEPSTIVLLGLGVVGIAGLVARNRKK